MDDYAGKGTPGPSPLDPMVQNQMYQSLISQGKTPEQASATLAKMVQAISMRDTPSMSDVPNINADPYGQQQIEPPNLGAPPGQPQVASGPSASPQSGVSPPPQPGLAEPMGPSSPFSNPELVGSVLGMGERAGQMARADAMRTAESPQGRTVNNGRTYVASNPLEHLVSGYGKYKGTKDVKRLEKEQTAAKKSIIDALRQQQMPIIKPDSSSTYEEMPTGGYNA